MAAAEPATDLDAISRREARQLIRASLLAAGMPASKADIVVDLSMHAAERAIDVMHATLEPLDCWEWISAFGISVGVLREHFANVQERMLAYGKEHGIGTIEISVGGARHGC